MLRRLIDFQPIIQFVNSLYTTILLLSATLRLTLEMANLLAIHVMKYCFFAFIYKIRQRGQSNGQRTAPVTGSGKKIENVIQTVKTNQLITIIIMKNT